MTLQVRQRNLSRMPAGTTHRPSSMVESRWDMAAGRGGAGLLLPLLISCALCGLPNWL